MLFHRPSTSVRYVHLYIPLKFQFPPKLFTGVFEFECKVIPFSLVSIYARIEEFFGLMSRKIKCTEIIELLIHYGSLVRIYSHGLKRRLSNVFVNYIEVIEFPICYGNVMNIIIFPLINKPLIFYDILNDLHFVILRLGGAHGSLHALNAVLLRTVTKFYTIYIYIYIVYIYS
jgi:hypothetical protein